MIRVDEPSPGNVWVSCEVSKRPFTRTNEFGMFCDAEVCQCEIESRKVSQDVIFDMIRSFNPNA